MSKSCDDDGAAHDQYLDCCQFTEAATRPEERTRGAEAANETSSSKLENMVFFQASPDSFKNEALKRQRLNNAGLRLPRPLAFLPKIQNKATESFPFRNSYQALLLSKEMLVRGCIKLAGAVRRTAVAVCFTPSAGADEADLPYSQLDKVTHALRRDAFGPLYLVT